MAKGQKQEASPTLAQEIFSVSGVFLAVFILLCLVSFSLPVVQQDGAQFPASGNWCGAVGNVIARLLMGFLGISSFWLAFLVLFFSVQFFSPKASFKRLPHIGLGCIGVMLASCGLFASMVTITIDIMGTSYPAGGFLGNTLAGFLQVYFGGPGSVLILLLILVFSLMLSARFSPYFLGQKFIRLCGQLGDDYRRRALKTKPARAVAAVASPAPAAGAVESEAAEDLVPSLHEPLRLVGHEEEPAEDFSVQTVSPGEYQLPGVGLLDKIDHRAREVDREYYYAVSKQLEEKLKDFGVIGKVVGISPGPVVTTYEFSPAPGIKINKVVSLADDLAMGLKVVSVRVGGSVPGKAALGIEIPNPQREIVYIRDIVASDNFWNSNSKLNLALGLDVVGQPVFADLAKMPHLLIAGATGSGKSVAINTIICSILFQATPEEVRFLMIDPKRIELSGYEAIPHLLHPVVVDPKMASRALQWAVREMEHRYKLLEEKRVKSFTTYNEVAEEKLPLVVIVVDELADLMMVCSRDVEDSIARLAQMARAAGMHLILATQRPSVDVLTGLIKANFPTRISFKVPSKIDSRTILDTVGAEHLLGAGDLLFLAPGTNRLQRIHGAYISEHETERVVTFLKEQGAVHYDESVLKIVEEPADNGEQAEDDYDEKYDEAVALVCETGQASISMVQRRLRVGYNRAARMIEIMEKEGIIGPSDGVKPREVLARKQY